MIIWRVLGGEAGLAQKRLPAVAAGQLLERGGHLGYRHVRCKLDPRIPRRPERFFGQCLANPLRSLPLNQAAGVA
jgi:hypothetical protein